MNTASFYLKLDKHDAGQQLIFNEGIGAVLFLDTPHGKEQVVVTDFITIGDKPKFCLVKAVL